MDGLGTAESGATPATIKRVPSLSMSRKEVDWMEE